MVPSFASCKNERILARKLKDLNIETFKCSKKCQENNTHCTANKIKFVQFASQEFNYGGLIKKNVASADKELTFAVV